MSEPDSRLVAVEACRQVGDNHTAAELEADRMSTAEQIIAEHRIAVQHEDDRVWCTCGEVLASVGRHAAHVVAALTNAGKSEWFVKRDGITYPNVFGSMDDAMWWASGFADGGDGCSFVRSLTIDLECWNQSAAAARVAVGST